MTPEERFTRLEQGWLDLQQSAKVMHEAITSLAATVDRYVASADARMKRIEENLDALIRAITAEHSNGKGKPGGN